MGGKGLLPYWPFQSALLVTVYFYTFLAFLASWGACILSGNFYSLFPLSPRSAFTQRHYYSHGKWGQSMALCDSRIAVASGFSFGGCQDISARNELAESYRVVIRGT